MKMELSQEEKKALAYAGWRVLYNCIRRGKKYVEDAGTANLAISLENSKTNCPGFDLPCYLTCSGPARITCFLDGCYMRTLFAFRRGPAAAAYRNYLFVKKHPAEFERYMKAWLKFHRPAFFRLHAGGDFFSQEYALMWSRIAKACRSTKFLAYTKQFDNVRGVDFPANFSLVLSAWGTDIEPPGDLKLLYPVARVACSDADIEALQAADRTAIKCPGNCPECGAMCWHATKKHFNVIFEKH